MSERRRYGLRWRSAQGQIAVLDLDFPLTRMRPPNEDGDFPRFRIHTSLGANHRSGARQLAGRGERRKNNRKESAMTQADVPQLKNDFPLPLRSLLDAGVH